MSWDLRNILHPQPILERSLDYRLVLRLSRGLVEVVRTRSFYVLTVLFVLEMIFPSNEHPCLPRTAASDKRRVYTMLSAIFTVALDSTDGFALTHGGVLGAARHS